MGSYSTLSDDELIVLLNERDTSAFEEIYSRYWPVLYQHARKMLRNNQKAEDLVQDIFSNIISSIERINIKPPLAAYLYRAVRNHVINLFDRDVHRQKYVDSMKGFYDRGEYSTDETIIENELKKRIETAIAGLPPKMRDVFQMSRVKHMSHQEIALAANVSPETVKAQMKNALRILRSKLTSIFFSL